jgi:hypothetical protein
MGQKPIESKPIESNPDALTQRHRDAERIIKTLKICL